MVYLKINDTMYPASFRQRIMDSEWNNRGSMAITLAMPHAEAASLFVDGLEWSLVQQFDPYTDADGSLVTPDPEETDYSDYCVAGPITDNRNGTITAKMGKLTDAEALSIILGEV
jgi:hypothetical protein